MTYPFATLESVLFRNGHTLPLEKDDVLLVVGPNNSGKSDLLRTIYAQLEGLGESSPVVQTANVRKQGTGEELVNWIASWSGITVVTNSKEQILHAHGANFSPSQVSAVWRNTKSDMKLLRAFFCQMLSAETRLELARPAPNVSLTKEYPTHPIHRIQRDPEMEALVNKYFRRAFGEQLYVHRNAGNQVPLYVGRALTLEPGEDRISPSYLRRLESLPALQNQGDGMKSFAGILLSIVTGNESIVLIDEPEAFLHPPQAFVLGQVLIEARTTIRQFVIATHSADIIKGALSASRDSVKIVRLSRSISGSQVSELSNERIRELWSDPLLRHSNVLDGLFHQGVVVCEADADCSFYSAVHFSVVASSSETRSRDLLFVHSSGKDRLPLLIRAMKAVHVPVVGIADFDVLNSEATLRACVEACNGRWEDVERDWRVVVAAITATRPQLDLKQAQNECNAAFADNKSDTVSIETLDRIRKSLRATSPWAQAKIAGRSALPRGDARQALDRLLTSLRAIGLFVVPVGEMESFLPSEGGHGVSWLARAMKRNIQDDPHLSEARQFMQDVTEVLTHPGL